MSDAFWSFPASSEAVEVLEWSTDVLQSAEGEQRIALRSVPREIVTFQHRLGALGMARAAELARASFAGVWQVPLWHIALQPLADLVPGATEILLNTALSDFRAGASLAIAIDGGDAVQVQVAAVELSRVVLSAPLVLPGVVVSSRVSVAPVRSAILTAAVEVSRQRQGDGVVSATWLLRDTGVVPPLAQTIYIGRPVLTAPSLLRSPLASSLRRTVEYVDNGLGPVAVEPVRDRFERLETITRRAQGAAERHSLRSWLWSLRGRQGTFWMPTWGRELQLRSAVTGGSVLMTVAPVAPLAGYPGRSIAIEQPTGLRFRSLIAAVQLGADHRLTISSNLGEPISAATGIHFMPLVRLDADRVEIQHRPTSCEVSLPVVEVAA